MFNLLDKIGRAQTAWALLPLPVKAVIVGLFSGLVAACVAIWEGLTWTQAIAAFLILGLAASVLAVLYLEIRQRYFARRGPDLLLLRPRKPYTLRWTPLKSAIPEFFPENEESPDTRDLLFRLKNVSSTPITDLVIQWKMQVSEPIHQVFLNGTAFASLRPQIGNGMFYLTRHDEHGNPQSGAVPADDTGVSEIPYCVPTPTTNDTLDVALPWPVVNSYAFRLVAAKPQPEIPVWADISGSEIQVAMTYRSPSGPHARAFVVRTSVVYFADTVFGQIAGADVEPEHRSSLNVRARVVFEVRRA